MRLRLFPILVSVAVACAACGGETDYNSNFIGSWHGFGTVTVSNASNTNQVTHKIEAVSPNRLRYADPACPMDGKADSALHATVEAFNCPESAQGCNITFAGSGDFTRHGAGMQLVIHGTATYGTGCSTVPPGTVLDYRYLTSDMTR